MKWNRFVFLHLAGETMEPDDAGYKLFLAQYIDRGPVANSRVSIKDNNVHYEAKDAKRSLLRPAPN